MNLTLFDLDGTLIATDSDHAFGEFLVERGWADREGFRRRNDAFYADYLAGQERVDAAWRDPRRWTRMSILNTARAGRFSSDRAIREYAERIWNAPPVRIPLD